MNMNEKIDWVPAEKFARDIVASAREHGFDNIKVECKSILDLKRPGSFWDGLTITWDGERHGENNMFHIRAVAHHYGSTQILLKNCDTNV